MDIKELDKAALANQPVSDGLNPFEQAYYISARGLYQQYRDGKITLEQAKLEKQSVIKLYNEGMRDWKLFIELHNIENDLRQLREQEFNSALEFSILESIDRILHQ